MAEDVLYKYGEIEFLPTRMDKYITQQEMNEGERERIVRARNIHLDWYHRHFCTRCCRRPRASGSPRPDHEDHRLCKARGGLHGYSLGR